jgi:WD40 repeat protein
MAWHPTSHFLFSTSDNNSVVAWHVRSERLLGTAARHTAKVRDAVCWLDERAPGTALLLSGSFDASVQCNDVSWT